MTDAANAPVEWDVLVDNASLGHIGPGQAVVLGRKPIRPLPAEEGRTRLDIEDSTRSMSKRHALFTTDEQGNATVEDLHSTNGTYVVTDSDDLWRIVADIPFDLPQEVVRLQLGDVPVDLIPVKPQAEPEPVSQPMAAVSDLFSYASAVQDTRSQGDPMSVDEIIDVRQGEPTHTFHTMKKDASPFSRLHDDVMRSERKQVLRVAADEDGSSASGVQEFHAAPESVVQAKDDSDELGVEELGADELGAGESPAADAAATGAAAAGGEAATHETDTCEANTGEDVEPSEPVEEEEPTEKKTEEPESTQSSEQTVEDPDEKFKPHPEQDAKSAANTAERRYKPAFEPGSVFDRLSRGEFNRKEEVVEAGGFTSEEAKLSRDFDQQFEIARQPKLLPYLAMNSGLYEDLYAWLEALGNEDIDAALKTNPGYRTWKEQGE